MTIKELFSIETTEHHAYVKSKTESYEYYQLAVLYGKKITLEELKKNCEKGFLGGNILDFNLLLAAKNNLKYHEVNKLNKQEKFKEMKATIDECGAGLVIAYEMLDIKECAKELVQKFCNLFASEKYSENDSILCFFTVEEQDKIKSNLQKLYECMTFDFSVDLEFKRADSSIYNFRADYGETDKECNVGLSERPFYSDSPGMWYEYGKEINVSCITTGVSIPLSVAYVNKQHKIIEIVERKADDKEIYKNKIPASNMLEVPSGFFEKNKIQLGDECKAKYIVANTDLSKIDYNEIEEQASKGNTFYQYKLGRKLFYGENIEINKKAGLKWLQKAADVKEPDALYCLGFINFEGEKLFSNKRKGIQLYEEAAELGQDEAITNLGNQYLIGDYLEKNVLKGKQLLELAASKGNNIALCNLGSLYYFGNGIEKNKELAFKYYMKAAKIGNPQAQYNVGLMYHLGDGVKPDRDECMKWTGLSADQGFPDAIQFVQEHVDEFMFGRPSLSIGPEVKPENLIPLGIIDNKNTFAEKVIDETNGVSVTFFIEKNGEYIPASITEYQVIVKELEKRL